MKTYNFVYITEEQLDLVSKDLQKCEHPMPMFQKIGGILSKDKGGHNTDLQKSLIVLNQQLDSNDSITSSLLNPQFKFIHVQNYLIDEYKKVLRGAKREKVQAAQNRSLNDSYVPDEYDELLTVPEIQGHIIATNYKFVWRDLCKSAKNNNLQRIDKIFKEEWLSVKNYDPDYLDFYCDIVKDITDSNKDIDVENITTWHKIFQNIINEGNRKSLEHKKHKEAITEVNKALDFGDPKILYAALANPDLELNVKVDMYAMPLLFEEMKLEKCECEKNLNESEIAASVVYLSSVAAVSQAVERGDESAVWTALNSNNLQVDGLRSHCRRRYLSALATALKFKIQENCACPLLTLEDIRDAVDMVNVKDDHNEERKYRRFLVLFGFKTNSF